jgi:hypothetical protein
MQAEQGINQTNSLISIMDVQNKDVDRKSDGTFSKGHKINNGWVKYSDRVAYIESNYTTEQILELVANPYQLNKLPVRDVQIIKRLAVTLADIAPTTRAEVRQELEAHLDRLEGKATQKVDVEQKIGIVQLVLEASKLTEGKSMQELVEQYSTPTLEHTQTIEAKAVESNTQDKS